MLLAGNVWAGSLEVGVGQTYKLDGVSNERQAVNIAYVEEGLLATEIAVGHLKGKDLDGDDRDDPDLEEPVNYIALGKRLTWKRVYVGLGGALVDQTSSRLSSAFQFKSQIGVLLGPVTVKLEHLSNAGIKGDNGGENIATVAYRHRF